MNDELDDPFSDVQLFLSRNISQLLLTKTIDEPWSYQMQSLLISKMQPEFKMRFPNRALSGPIVQKVFEKVSHFTELIQRHTRLLTPKGTLDLDAIIRYHLKRCELKPRSAQQTASHIAYKVSEWIATIEGRRCCLTDLHKRIWAAYKNLCTHIDTEHPCEIDDIDRLIIKHQIALLSNQELIPERLLRNRLHKTFEQLQDFSSETFVDECTLITAELLSSAHHKAFAPTMTDREQDALVEFVSCQLRPGPISEIGKRLCTLYPLAQKLPKQICPDKLRSAIHYTYALACGRTLPTCPILDTSIYALLNAQVIALIGQKPFPSVDEVTSVLLRLFACTPHLPTLDAHEPILWHELFAQTKPRLNQELTPFVEQALIAKLCDDPHTPFDALLAQTLAELKNDKKLAEQPRDLDMRLRTWTVQGDMLHRWTYFEQQNVLYQLTVAAAKKYRYTDGKITTSNLSQVVADRFFESHPHMHPFEAPVKVRITAICKNAWYHHKDKQAPIQKLKAWHQKRLEQLYPQLPKREINQKLRATLRRIAPLCA